MTVYVWDVTGENLFTTTKHSQIKARLAIHNTHKHNLGPKHADARAETARIASIYMATILHQKVDSTELEKRERRIARPCMPHL